MSAVEREVNLLKDVANVKQVLFLGTSPNGRAVQIEALADINGFGIQPAVDAINATVATFPRSERHRVCSFTWPDRSPTM